MKAPKATGRFENRADLESFLFHKWASSVQSLDVVAKSAGIHKSVAIHILNNRQTDANAVYEVYAAANDLLDRIQRAPHNQPKRIMMVAETVHDLKEILTRTQISDEVLKKYGLPPDLAESSLVEFVENEMEKTEEFTSSLSVFKG